VRKSEKERERERKREKERDRVKKREKERGREIEREREYSGSNIKVYIRGSFLHHLFVTLIRALTCASIHAFLHSLIHASIHAGGNSLFFG